MIPHKPDYQFIGCCCWIDWSTKELIVTYPDGLSLLFHWDQWKEFVLDPQSAGEPLRAEWKHRNEEAGRLQRETEWSKRLEAAENEGKKAKRGIWAKK